MKMIKDFLTYLYNLDIELRINDGRLRCNAPKGVLTPALQKKLTERKEEIIMFLSEPEESVRIQAEQGIVSGPVPLTVNNHHGLNFDGFFDVNYHNMGNLFEVPHDMDPGLVEQIVGYLIRYHDGMRSRFVHEETGWQQFIDTPNDEVPFIYIDLSELPVEKQGAAIESVANELHGSFDLLAGLLLRVALFRLGARDPGRLLFIVHHTIVDAFSWQIFLKDTQKAYLQLMQKGQIQFPPKTTSLKQYTEQLYAYARSEEVRGELEFWLHLPWDQVDILPADYPEGHDSSIGTSGRMLSLSLESEETGILLRKIPKIYKTELIDTLLMALVKVLARWTGRRWVYFNVQDSGRGVIPDADDIDLSHTVGNLICRRHFVLECEETENPGEALQRIKKQLRRIPNRGFGYSLLRYCSGDVDVAKKLASLIGQDQDTFFFNYLGQMDEPMNKVSGPFRPARESTGDRNHPKNKPCGLRCDVIVSGGRLVLNWIYSEKLYKPATVERVAGHYIQTLQDLIAYCGAL